MNNANSTAVIIPFYKTHLSKYENIALTQCMQVLKKHPVIAIKPASLDLSAIEKYVHFTDVRSFDDNFFTGIDGYNKLMLSTTFYQHFLDFEFILIYQLDAFVFRDELDFWSSKPYDYIGAPWIRPIDDPDFVKTIKTKFQNLVHQRYNIYENGLPSAKQFENQVGNGGFSLRRVKKFFELTKLFSNKIEEYHLHTEHQFHEDAFWSIEINRKKKWLNIPSYKNALPFSFENSPERAYRLTGNQLPFGCHAWDENLNFWTPFIMQQGHDLIIKS